MQTGATDQAVINPPLPSDLNLTLNAKTTVTIGPFSQLSGDVAGSGPKGSVLFDVSSSQGFFGQRNVLANTVTIRSGASAGHVFGNDITVEGSVNQQSLGLDPAALPQVPAPTTITPGTANVTLKPNQAKQLCPGQFGAISLGAGATLSLNGGVYQMTRLTLADGAKLEPSEPVVILIAGTLTTGFNGAIQPSAQALNPMTAGDIRIEAAGNITLGDGTQVRAHLLAPNSKLTTGKNISFTGAGWAKSISIGASNFVTAEGAFSAQAPTVPPPCNDNNLCTVDQCVTSGSLAMCTNTPVPTGTSCEDDNTCNGEELCSATGQCQAGTPLGSGTSCADADACNGDERCNGTGTCLAGDPPVVSDGNACTVDACAADTGVSHIPLPDGTVCAGRGVCQAGECSVKGTVFSEDFVQFQDASAQCDSWNDFLSNQLVDGSYGSVTVSGTFDSVGVTCSDPDTATQICQALHHNSFTQVSCGGHFWSVGSCGGTEVVVDGFVCGCEFGVHDVRPCTGFGEWGGINSDTCNPPSQNLTVVCE
ncbi:MAG: hypothetical protein ABIY55_03925 [Kofleriaceae bacterium]